MNKVTHKDIRTLKTAKNVINNLRLIAELIPYTRNSRTHSAEQIAQIAASIAAFGMVGAIVVRGDTIAKGHGTLAAIQSLYAAGELIYPPPGAAQGAIAYPVGTVPVLDATGWTDDQFRAYVIADNKLAENAGWNEDILRAEISALADVDFDLDLLGFADDELLDISAAEVIPETQKKPKQLSSASFAVVVTAADEQQQAALLAEFEERGLSCRALML